MTTNALRLSPRRLRRPRLSLHRHRRSIEPALPLLSVAGAVGAPVLDASGKHLATLADLVVRLDPGETRPPLHGVIVRVGRTRAFVPVAAIITLKVECVEVAGVLSRRPVRRQPGLVALAEDVLDRQLVDVDGVDVVRVSDLVLGDGPDGFRLVGFDVSVRTLLRRLGPRTLRERIAAERIYDWASVGAFSVKDPGEAGSVLKLTESVASLSRLGDRERGLLFADLPPTERQQLTDTFEAEPPG